MSPTTIFAPASTPADAIAGLSTLVLGMKGTIFAVVCALLVYTLVRFRRTRDDGSEPPQVYGSNQVELAWTVVPILVNNRTVTLVGVVDNEGDKTLAGLKARGVMNVNQVDNELEVATKS